MGKRNDRTLDLLAWEPPSIVPQVDTHLVHAERLRDQVARAVALVLRECPLSRDEIAARMEAYLGEPISTAMLNVYASQAREDQTISFIRLVALADATGDMRALQVGVAPLKHSLVPDQYVAAIEDAMLDDKIEELQKRRQLARRTWRGIRP